MSHVPPRTAYHTWKQIKRAQPWRYVWLWKLLILSLLLVVVCGAPQVARNVAAYIESEAQRLGRMGMTASAASVAPLTTLFGGKRMEQDCRAFLERTFGVSFPCVRPDFLKRAATKRNLELDCYNADLRLAVEYMGPQHRVYLPLLHKFDRAHFDAQQERDAWKANRCRELGIDLIVVSDEIPRSQLESYLKSELQKLGRI